MRWRSGSRSSGERSAALPSGFSALWAITALSNLGDGVRKAALPLLVVTLTRDPALVAGLTAAIYLPSLLLGLQAGAIVDRLDRRVILLGASSAQVGVLVLLTAAVLAGVASVLLVFGAVFLLGTAEALHENAAHAVLPSLVGDAALERTNSRLLVTDITMKEFIGPPLGGAAFALLALAPFAANAGLAACAALVVLLALPRRPPPPKAASLPLRREIREGLSWLARHRLLRTLVGTAALHDFVTGAWEAVLVLLALEQLGISGASYGLLLTAGAVGGLLGGAAAPRLAAALGTSRALGAAMLCSGVAQVVMITPNRAIAAAGLAASSATYSILNVIEASLRQRLVPDELRGRVNSALRTICYGAAALGALAGGLLAENAGVRAVFIAGAPVPIVLSLLVLRVTQQELRA
jgi:MFS family permease